MDTNEEDDDGLWRAKLKKMANFVKMHHIVPSLTLTTSVSSEGTNLLYTQKDLKWALKLP